MTRFDLVKSLSREARKVNPSHYCQSMRLLLQLAIACREPERFLQAFRDAPLNRHPVLPKVVEPEQPIDWSADDDGDLDMDWLFPAQETGEEALVIR